MFFSSGIGQSATLNPFSFSLSHFWDNRSKKVQIHSTSRLKQNSALWWLVETHWGKSMTRMSWVSASRIRLNSLKSLWIRPCSANLIRRSSVCLNTLSQSPNQTSLIKVGPSMRLITTPCLFQSRGTGVGNPASYSFCMNVYSLVDDILDKYSQLYDVLFLIQSLFSLIVLKEVLPNLVNLSTTGCPSPFKHVQISDSFPTPSFPTTSVIVPLFTNVWRARQSYPEQLSLYPSYLMETCWMNLSLRSLFMILQVLPVFRLAMEFISLTGTNSWFFMPISIATRTRNSSLVRQSRY